MECLFFFFFFFFFFLFLFFFLKIDSSISLIWKIYIIDELVDHTDCNLFHLDLYHWWFQQILQETHSSCWKNPKNPTNTLCPNLFTLLAKPKSPTNTSKTNCYMAPSQTYCYMALKVHYYMTLSEANLYMALPKAHYYMIPSKANCYLTPSIIAQRNT